MKETTTVGIDLAKNLFHLIGRNTHGNEVKLKTAKCVPPDATIRRNTAAAITLRRLDQRIHLGNGNRHICCRLLLSRLPLGRGACRDGLAEHAASTRTPEQGVSIHHNAAAAG